MNPQEILKKVNQLDRTGRPSSDQIAREAYHFMDTYCGKGKDLLAKDMTDGNVGPASAAAVLHGGLLETALGNRDIKDLLPDVPEKEIQDNLTNSMLLLTEIVCAMIAYGYNLGVAQGK